MNLESAKNTDAMRFMFVDDDEISIMALKRGMKQLGISNTVQVALNGVEAIEILNEALQSEGTLPLYVVVLDLNMPKMGGLEFLKKIRNSENFKKLVVFILTTSDEPSDIASAYEHNIAGYIVKEVSGNSYRDTLAMIKAYSELVVLPS